MDREGHGPEFDDRLIKLVKENAAIYDVSHPHYRRTPVRIAIWDNIAKQLGAPSRFLQTKWKNIRYNYLQEQKCLETGTTNANIRKRKFTEDLSFLKYTAYRRDGITPTKSNCNGSDDSNSYLNADNLQSLSNTYEVIELDHSEDEPDEFFPDVSAFLAPMNGLAQNSPADKYEHPDTHKDGYGINKNNTNEDSLIQNLQKSVEILKHAISPPNSPYSNRSSPLLTPLSTITKNGNEEKCLNNTSKYSEVTIQPLAPASAFKRQLNLYPNDHPMSNSGKREATMTSTHISSDPIELYCLSLADCFRAMSRSERERVKYEFAKILKDAHYKDQL